MSCFLPSAGRARIESLAFKTVGDVDYNEDLCEALPFGRNASEILCLGLAESSFAGIEGEVALSPVNEGPSIAFLFQVNDINVSSFANEIDDSDEILEVDVNFGVQLGLNNDDFALGAALQIICGEDNDDNFLIDLIFMAGAALGFIASVFFTIFALLKMRKKGKQTRALRKERIQRFKHNQTLDPTSSLNSSGLEPTPVNYEMLGISVKSTVTDTSVSTLKKALTKSESTRNGKIRRVFTQDSSNPSSRALTLLSRLETIETTSLKPKLRQFIERILKEAKIPRKAGNKRNKQFDAFNKKMNTTFLSLREYLFHLVSSLGIWFDDDCNEIGQKCLLFALAYIESLNREYKDSLCARNAHKLFGVAMLVAAKFLEDEAITNGFWAEVMSVGSYELNNLEQIFCFSIGFKFFIEEEDFQELLQRFSMFFTQESLHRIYQSVSTDVFTKTDNC